jgi:hypothetical protein
MGRGAGQRGDHCLGDAQRTRRLQTNISMQTTVPFVEVPALRRAAQTGRVRSTQTRCGCSVQHTTQQHQQNERAHSSMHSSCRNLPKWLHSQCTG